MEFADIRQLMRDFSDSSIGSLSIEWGDFKISMEKQQTTVKTAACQTITVEAPSDVETDRVEAEAKAGEFIVRSPVVGVYYATPTPGAQPYVTEGQHVDKGQTLCIVEAMKMMNEIPAPVSGVVTRIVIEPETAVEFEQPLMFIRQD